MSPFPSYRRPPLIVASVPLGLSIDVAFATISLAFATMNLAFANINLAFAFAAIDLAFAMIDSFVRILGLSICQINTPTCGLDERAR